MTAIGTPRVLRGLPVRGWVLPVQLSTATTAGLWAYGDLPALLAGALLGAGYLAGRRGMRSRVAIVE